MARSPASYRRSEEHTSELQSHSFISYAVFCLKKKKTHTSHSTPTRGRSGTTLTPAALQIALCASRAWLVLTVLTARCVFFFFFFLEPRPPPVPPPPPPPPPSSH